MRLVSEMRRFFFAIAFAIGFSGTSQAATIDLASKGLQLGNVLSMSTDMSISDTAPFDLGFPIGVIPGFFQALDSDAGPALELNTGDGVNFNLSVTPGYTGASTETAREGEKQLELIFGTDVFARLILGDNNSLDEILTGATFSDASLTVWELESISAVPIPLPATLPLLLASLGGAFVLSRRRLSSKATE